MTVPRLIALVSAYTKPVEVRDIRDRIVEWGYHDRIFIRSFNKPSGNLFGNFVEYKTQGAYGKENSYFVVNYNENLTNEWKRLVCIKELIHAMDDISVKISTKSQLNDLLAQILHDGSSINKLSHTVLLEEMAIYQALAIMSPEEKREVMFDKYHKNEITLNDVAKEFQIPSEYAGTLMLPNWKSFRDKMVGNL